MKIIAALSVFGVLALASAGASGAKSDGKPPFGVPDPALLVLRSADVGAVPVAGQGYYADKGFVSSYARDFRGARVGKTPVAWLESDVEVALIWSDARDFVTAFHHVAARHDGQTALKKAFASLDLKGIAIAHVTVLQPKPLTGTDGWDVELHFTLNGQPAQGHVAFFSADRFLGELMAVGTGDRALPRATIAQLGRLMTRRFRAVKLPQNVSPPSITGTPAVGQTLTASPGNWANGPLHYRFDWERCTGTSCNIIQGATGSTYTVTGADVGFDIRVGVLATNPNGTRGAISAPASVPGAPVNVTAPVISGTAASGQVLTASSGTWTGAPTAYAYVWKHCDVTLTNCTVVGADAPTYTLTPADAGWRIMVAVTASNAAGAATAVSAATGLVSPTP